MSLSISAASVGAPARPPAAPPPAAIAAPSRTVDSDGDHDGDTKPMVAASAGGSPSIAAAVQANIAASMTG